MKTITVGPCRSLGLTLKFSSSGDGGGVITAIRPSCPFRNEVEVGDILSAVNGARVFSADDVRIGSGETRVLSIFPASASAGESSEEQGDGSAEESSSGEERETKKVGGDDEEEDDDDISVSPCTIEECSSLQELDRLAAHYEDKLRRIKERTAHLKSRCSRNNCNEPSACPRRNLCKKHGRMCRIDGCTNWMRGGGLCQKHGGVRVTKQCSVEGCERVACFGKLCTGHAPVKPARYYCKMEGCTKTSIQGGVCITHGGKYTINRCKVEGCDRARRKGGVCVRHGAKTECRVEGCTLHAQKKGVCARHMTMMQKEGS